MKRSNILIALACLIIPGLLTVLWFYAGLPTVNPASIPDFPSIDLPVPPLSTEISRQKPPAKPTTTVLFDMTHGNAVTLSEIDPFIRSIESFGGSIQVTVPESDLGQLLKTANAFVSLSPLMEYSALDKNAVTAFVQRGGKLVIAADPTRNTMASEGILRMLSGVDAANLLGEPFDMAFMDDYLYDMVTNEGNFRNVIFSDFEENPLTRGVARLVVYGGHSIRSHGGALASSSATTFSSASDQAGDYSPFAMIQYGEGSVIAMGDLSLMTTQYVFSADNQVFTHSLAGYLTRETRKRSLADFPIIFDGKITLIPDTGIDMNSDLLTAISKLEKAVGTEPGNLIVSRDEVTDTHRIILSTFKMGDRSKDIIEELKIDLSPEPEEENTPATTSSPEMEPTETPTPDSEDMETNLEDVLNISEGKESQDSESGSPTEIEIPGMQRITTENLGLVGLVREKDHTTLIIMASSLNDLKTFIGQVAVNGLSGCFIQNDVAACKVNGSEFEPQG